MGGNTSNWIEVHEPETIQETKKSFREYFWGEEQARFRVNLYIERYKNERKKSMAEYAMNLARQAKYLEPPMINY